MRVVNQPLCGEVGVREEGPKQKYPTTITYSVVELAAGSLVRRDALS